MQAVDTSMLKDRNIAVLMGGMSCEQDVSRKTGRAILTALHNKGYRAEGLEVTDDVAHELRRRRVEVAFIALHGPLGEDGTIQGLLEIMGIPYTGSGVLASALASNKVCAKKIFAFHGLPTPAFQCVRSRGSQGQNMDNGTSLPLPLVVKPAEEGSTIGISIVRREDDIPEAVCRAAAYGPEILLESWVPGRECTVGILCEKALPPVEIRPRSGFYDFHSKYTHGETDYIVPAPIDDHAAGKMQDIAVKAFHALGCRGAARVDFILHEDGCPYILEINTIPGMTETSLLPMAARAAGIDFATLAETILQAARLDKTRRPGKGDRTHAEEF